MHRHTRSLRPAALAAAGAALLGSIAVLLACASTRPAAAATATSIHLRKTSVGTILVGPGNETLYAFSRDRHNRDACASIHKCLATWPLLAVHGSLSAGPGVRRSLLSTIDVHRTRQVTYAGHPLYSYADDSAAGDVGYVGASEFGGTWPAITAKGRLVR